ncbi:DUF4235 domain-containing protein [Nocardioides massiliensis]|uniref:DUF4235 domain-containing protein n=1 Tax=Nocardioides massiliensis TaxID=1325935 RepID=A0ABT9NUX6_9ACTN|nr:DUF4235 domain-containing protein [Nocardioides massiliensis]MDP9824233.1 hypothetical protein [Nocardioides massiliensis]
MPQQPHAPVPPKGNRAAKILYRPIGLIGGLLAGVLAGKVTKVVWHKASGVDGDPPKSLESEYSMKQVIAAAALQAAVFAVVKTAIDRGGARVFQRWTGEWPGD